VNSNYRSGKNNDATNNPLVLQALYNKLTKNAFFLTCHAFCHQALAKHHVAKKEVVPLSRVKL
jgi:inosine/xanthosine triphosphate pyrophosphatase family protein